MLPVRHLVLVSAALALTATAADIQQMSQEEKELARTEVRNLQQTGADDRDIARTYLKDLEEAVAHHYAPAKKVTDEFHRRCAAALAAVGKARNSNEAFGIIADALASLDPRIRFYPPTRSATVDYGWRWQLYGNKAYVTQLDQVGDARKQGLNLGDQVVSIEGMPLDRETAQQVYYAFNELAPSPVLHVQVQAAGGEPRSLTLAATLREPPKLRAYQENGIQRFEYVRTKRETQRDEEFRDVKNHVRRVGQTVVWRVEELRRRISDVSDGLKAASGAGALILDLRGQYGPRPETVFRLLDGLFAEDFEAGIIRENEKNIRLHVSGGRDSFHGTLLVLVDSDSRMFAEVLARVVQWKQRGVIVGDRTMGRVFQEETYRGARGVSFNFTNAFVSIPAGEVLLAAEPQLDGRGVIPDLLLLPKPADLAGRRDVVLAKALAMLKETITPEEAYALFPRNEADEDE